MNFVGNKYELLEEPENKKQICQFIKKDLKEHFGKGWKFSVYPAMFDFITIEVKQVPVSFFNEDEDKFLNLTTIHNHKDFYNQIFEIGNAYRKEEDREPYDCRGPKKNYQVSLNLLSAKTK